VDFIRFNEDIAEKMFGGEYWLGGYSWWSLLLAESLNEQQVVMNLKAEFLEHISK